MDIIRNVAIRDKSEAGRSAGFCEETLEDLEAKEDALRSALVDLLFVCTLRVTRRINLGNKNFL